MIPAANCFRKIVFVLAFTCANLHGQAKFCAVGDVLLDRGVRGAIEKNGSVDFPFQQIQPVISQFDWALCNLECPVTARATDYPLRKRFSFRAEPEFLAGLQRAGFNLATVANNHTIDQGKSGLLETIANLKSAGILPVGGGENQAVARQPVLLEKNGETVALFGCLEFLLEATVFLPDQPYPAFPDMDSLCEDISKYDHQVDHVIVTFHWGIENHYYPTSRQIAYAHRVIDAGADVVLGHHPHVLQPVEFYQNRPILYSLGNFVFDNHQPDQRKSAIFACEFFQGEMLRPRLLPVEILEIRPEITAPEVAREIFVQLQKISEEFNTRLDFNGTEILLAPQTAFENPVREIWCNGLKFSLFESKIVVSEKGRCVNQYHLPDSLHVLVDGCLVAEGAWVYLYAIVAQENLEIRRIAVFPFHLVHREFSQPALDAHTDFRPWKILAADVDADANPDLLVGVFKSTRYDSVVQNRIFVYNREANFIYPKWFGSRLSYPILDFKVVETESTQLVTLERSAPNQFRIIRYRWNGFGFDSLREAAFADSLAARRAFNWEK